MYVPADQACSGPTGKTPPSPQSVARDRAARARIQEQVVKSNRAVKGLVDRNWQDFVTLGPQVAWQVLNQPAPAYEVTGTESANPVGVEVGDGHSRAWVPPQRTNSGPSAAVIADGEEFVRAFGGDVNPGWSVYTGPLPATGSAGSMVYGGSPSNRTATPSTRPARTPNAAAGYFRSTCPMPEGVDSLPLGEPDYGTLAATATETSNSNGALLVIAAVLGLAGLAFLTEHREERKRRKAAK